MDFLQKYQSYLNEINKEMEHISAIPDVLQKSVFKAIHYALSGGGKRIRPVLMVAVCDMLGGNIKDAVKVACAIECIHNYSLIHDDLPCMDNDDLRRGRPTCHKVFEENIALLAGDGLLNLAFELLSDSTRYEELDDGTLLRLIAVIAKASGVYGMIGGQVIDLENEGKSDVPEKTLRELHRLKTGELIRVSAECGCICAGLIDKKDNQYQKIIEFSAKLGLAFQIKDDILDVIGLEDTLGKPVGSDEESEKSTFVTLLGLDGAKAELTRLTQEAKNAVDSFNNNGFLLDFADFLLHRDY